ncbi:molybdate ABC transporter substrate-binding protein [Eubacteriales bacterium DFI.9.88]|nr:molybdate ABC transporter substrate-binding protein [Eubacteriales bacterium DFI.9.88]
MKKLVAIVMMLTMTVGLLAGCGSGDGDNQETGGSKNLEGKSLMIYCGAGMKEPFQKISDTFQEKTGCQMKVTFANAAQIQTQINTSKEGDMFIAGSAEELKPVKETVSKSEDLVKHIPVIAVQKGNPKNIKSIKDLAGHSVRVLIGDPDSTPIGKIAQKAFADAGIKDQVKLAATTTTAPQMTTALSAGEADAATVWKENVKGDNVEIAEVPDMEAYIKTIPAASLSTTKDADTLKAFEAFLGTKEAKDIWTEFGYELV